MSKKRLIIVIIIGAVIIGVTLYFLLRSKGNNAYNFRTGTVERGDLQSIVTATGTLEPLNIVEVGSQVSGRIAKLYADFNSLVKEGQVMAELDQSIFITKVKQSAASYRSAQAELEKAKVHLTNAKKSLARALSLAERDLISIEEKEQAEETYNSSLADVQSLEARLEEAKAQLDANKVDLEHTIITSPINGIVISRNINIGQTVAASFQAPVLFDIAEDLTRMNVICHVDEADIGRVQPDQKVTFTVDAYPEEQFDGKVVQVRYAPETVQNVVTYNAIVEVQNNELKLRPGMTATVSIIFAEKKDVLKGPQAALRFIPPPEILQRLKNKTTEHIGDNASPQKRSQEGPMRRGPFKNQNVSVIWALEKNKNLQPIPIITGLTDLSSTEIVKVLRGELKEGQEIVIGLEGGSQEREGSPARGFRMMVR